jgi:hypothetical protein
MFRLVVYLAAILLVLAFLSVLRSLIRSGPQRPARRIPRPALPGRLRGRTKPYDWKRRTDQAYRKMKRIEGPSENREGIVGFIDSHRGVEAFMEPRTAMSRLSVVLVAEDGEWKRFELASDAFVRELSRSRGLPVLDAARVGYPQRMRDYERRRRSSEGEPGQDDGGG